LLVGQRLAKLVDSFEALFAGILGFCHRSLGGDQRRS
jgi:hypothetical protein